MEQDEFGRGVRIERRGAGYAARGACFYVWDEDPRALLEAARDLARAASPRTPLQPRPLRSARAPARRS